MAMATMDEKYGEIIIRFANSSTLKKAIKALAIKAGKSFPKIKETIADDFYEDKKKNIMKLLDELMAIDNLNDSKLISDYIQTYNERCTSKMQINKRGKIENKYFFHNLESINYDDLLVFSIIRFLINFKFNKQFIRRCKFEDCKKYFLSKQKSPRVKNCPRCRYRSTYTKEQYAAWYKKTKMDEAREALKDKIINLLKQDYQQKNITLQIEDDTRLSNLLKRSNWSIERAFEASEQELKRGKTEKFTATE